MRFHFADFPVLGPQSNRTAEAAWCALDKDAYWEYHDTVFANHPSQGGESLSDDRLVEFADALDLDMDAFTECFESGEHAVDVVDSFKLGRSLDVSGTPTIFVNGEKIEYRGWDSLKALLDELVANGD